MDLDIGSIPYLLRELSVKDLVALLLIKKEWTELINQILVEKIYNLTQKPQDMTWTELKNGLTYETIDTAIANGYFNLIRVFHDKDEKILWGKDLAVVLGFLDVLKYLDSLGYVMNQRDANIASFYNRAEVLEWLNQKGIYPSRSSTGFNLGFNYVTGFGPFDFVRWYIQKGFKPTQEAVNKMAFFQQIKTLQFLDKIGIYPTNIEEIIKYGKILTVEWLIKGGKITINEANTAAKFASLEVLELLAKYQIFPDLEGINSAAYMNLEQDDDDYHDGIEEDHIQVIQWINDQTGLWPDQTGANLAAEAGSINMIKYIWENTGIKPDQEGIIKTLKKGYHDVFKYIMSLS